jgi:universal stress protein E
MHRFKNILAVELGTRLSRAVIRRAADLARRNEGRLTLLTVEETMPGYLRPLLGPDRSCRMERMLEDERRKGLTKRAAEVVGDEIPVEIGSMRGEGFVEVIRQVQRGGHDLVIVPGGESRSWYGSTLKHILRKCPCPVWVLRPEWTGVDRRVLVATDLGSEDGGPRSPLNRRLMEIGTSLARQQDARLHVVSVWTLYGESVLRRRGSPSAFREAFEQTEAENRRRMKELVAAAPIHGVHFDTHLLRGKPADRIADLADDLDVDVLVMGTVGRSGLGGILIGNTAEDVLARVERPVLAIKPQGFETPVAVGEKPGARFERLALGEKDPVLAVAAAGGP